MEKLFSYVILFVAAALVIPGCFAEESSGNQSTDGTVVSAEETANATVAANATKSVNATEVNQIETEVLKADVNTTNLTMTVNQTAIISLQENPTTGYTWNVTNSTGLVIVNDTYTQNKAQEGMVGVGGVHDWVIIAIEAGNQTFDAVYKHSWEPTTSDDETYTLNVTVV